MPWRPLPSGPCLPDVMRMPAHTDERGGANIVHLTSTALSSARRPAASGGSLDGFGPFSACSGCTCFSGSRGSGAALHNALILVPSNTPMSLGEQRRIGQAIGARSFTVLRPVALVVIAWGVLRGTLGDSDDARRSYCGRRVLNFVRRVAARLLRAVRARPGVSDPSVPVRWGWAPRQPPVAIFILVAS
jgi:hypothetical protein